MEWSDSAFQNLPSLKFSLQMTFYILVGMFALFSAVIYYHWNTYSDNKGVSRITLIVYLITTLPLVLIMGGVLLVI